LFLGFGDIQRSHGARVYLLSFVDALRETGQAVRAFFLQQIVPGPANTPETIDGTAVSVPPGSRCAKFIPAIVWRMYELAWANWRAFRVVLADGRKSDACIVVGPGLLLLAPVLAARYSRLAYIQHGIAEEFLLSGRLGDRIKYWINKALERKFVPRCGSVVVVSEKMAQYCRREYGVRNTLLVPCCVHLRRFQWSDDDRLQMRSALHLTDRFVFVYSGGAARWQCVSETVEFFRSARARFPNAFLLVLSADIETWRRTLGTLAPQDYQVMAVPHADVGRYLRLADAAFLLRKNSMVNVVSAPVKFAEYLACGLPVITSPYVGDYSSLTATDRLGILVDPDDASTWPAALDGLAVLTRDPSTRTRCRRAAEQLSWEGMAPRLRVALHGDGPIGDAVEDGCAEPTAEM